MTSISYSIRLIMAVLWTAFIVYALLSEPSHTPRFPWLIKPGVDKLIHAVLFGIESFLVLLAFAGKQAKPAIWINIIWCFLLGAGLELAQHLWINGRSGEVLDLIADVLGAVVAAWVFTIVRNKF